MSGIPGVDGIAWDPSGTLSLSGDALQIFSALERQVRHVADRFGARQERHLPVVPLADLQRIDYFSNFPHLVNVPVFIEPEDQDLREFAGLNAKAAGGWHGFGSARLRSHGCALAPATCYPIYGTFRGARLPAGGVHVASSGTCFRAERHYEPLTRQWSFTMAEIVHIGSQASVATFVADSIEIVSRLARTLGLTLDVQVANDPFFERDSPQGLHQRMFPTKREFVFDGTLAIGSINNHRTFFGREFDIACEESVAHSACLAFGLERWLNALRHTHGPRVADMPDALFQTSSTQPSMKEEP